MELRCTQCVAASTPGSEEIDKSVLFARPATSAAAAVATGYRMTFYSWLPVSPVDVMTVRSPLHTCMLVQLQLRRPSRV